MNYSFFRENIWIFVILAVWDIIWKGIALWKAAGNKQRNWFIALLIVNSVGILPIIYLKFFSSNYAKSKKGRV